MYHFFVNSHQMQEGRIRITGTDVNHICNVLRMQRGDEILISDEEGNDYSCRLESLDRDCVEAVILCAREENHELPARITLYQGLPKADKMEWIVQKATELGAARIVPVAMSRSVVKLDPKKAEAKAKRWEAVAQSAAKQAKRSVIPEVSLPLSWKRALEEMKQETLLLVPYESAKGMEHTRELIAHAAAGTQIGILIGPEGGFSEEEIADAHAARGQIMTLGKRILRTETAGMAVLAMLGLHLEV